MREGRKEESSMHFRRRSAAVMTAALLSVLVVMPVSAHGHHGHHRQSSTVDTGCPVCTVAGCTETGRHTHDGCEYCGYDHEGDYCDGSCVVDYRRLYGIHGCYR